MKDIKKQTIFDNNNNYTVNINTKSDHICEDLIQSNLKLIHSHIVSNHLSQRPPNKVLQDQTPSVSPAELLLSRETRRTLAQLRTNKSPLLVSYLYSIGDPRHPSPLCPLWLMHDHTSSNLFECNPYQPPFLAWTSGRIPTKWSLSLPPGVRDCWLPHDSGAGLCWQHVGGVGSTTTTTTFIKLVFQCGSNLCHDIANNIYLLFLNALTSSSHINLFTLYVLNTCSMQHFYYLWLRI